MFAFYRGKTRAKRRSGYPIDGLFWQIFECKSSVDAKICVETYKRRAEDLGLRLFNSSWRLILEVDEHY